MPPVSDRKFINKMTFQFKCMRKLWNIWIELNDNKSQQNTTQRTLGTYLCKMAKLHFLVDIHKNDNGTRLALMTALWLYMQYWMKTYPKDISGRYKMGPNYWTDIIWNKIFWNPYVTHYVMAIAYGIDGSDNGLSAVWHQAILWFFFCFDLSSIGPLWELYPDQNPSLKQDPLGNIAMKWHIQNFGQLVFEAMG